MSVVNVHHAISADVLRASLTLRDLSDPAHGPHAMQELLALAIDALRKRWRCEILVQRASPVVSIADNYGMLGYADDATTRDARYTRYVDEGHMLRSHSTAAIPGALRLVARMDVDDVLVATPGLCYRRDVIDRIHVGEPHQLDLWRIRRGTPLTRSDLEAMIDALVDALMPGHEWRAKPADHPYTTDGLEVDVLKPDGVWVELLECGLAAPAVLDGCGLSPRHHTGLALGLGLDRALMLRKGIDDIRLLRERDPRVAGQMLDLEPYRPVSSQPATVRDLSLAVDSDLTPEELGDRVRGALGSRADDVEAVEVLDETLHAELPPQAIDRLGMAPNHKNVLLRLTLRHMTRTLTAPEANELRNDIYAALHQGSAHEWAD